MTASSMNRSGQVPEGICHTSCVSPLHTNSMLSPACAVGGQLLKRGCGPEHRQISRCGPVVVLSCGPSLPSIFLLKRAQQPAGQLAAGCRLLAAASHMPWQCSRCASEAATTMRQPWPAAALARATKEAHGCRGDAREAPDLDSHIGQLVVAVVCKAPVNDDGPCRTSIHGT